MDSVPSRVEDILLALINNSEYDGPIISRVEQILYSFLENSEYAAEPESRVEAILVALKAAGLYNDAVISRIEKILYSKLNGTEYTAEPETRVEELLLEWELIEEKELTGVVPLLFNADGTPLLDYLISGNAVQNGTPTPDNPIQPQECGERTGNLFLGEFSQFDNTGGTGTTYAYFALTEQCTLTAIPKEDITISGTYNLGLSGNGGNANDGISWAIAGGRTYQKGIPISITNQSMLFCSIYPKNTETLNWILEHFDIMLNLGSTALPYEPYGYKIPISSANTITPVYLGDVETTRKIRKLVLMGGQHDGNIDITPRGIICITPLRTLKNVGDAYCTHYKYVNQSQGSNMPYNSFTTRGGDDTSLWFKTEYATIADFKDYLAAQYAAGTPVTIWYVLAEPETAVINEPLMKIGDYADTLSMEQAGAEIPTINGENTLDVLTAVKPSEVYIKYKGR